MKYTIRVITLTSSNGDYNSIRYNKVPERIIKTLLKYHFSFMVGIAENTIGLTTAKNYIEVYTKQTSYLLTNKEEADKNEIENDLLIKTLNKMTKKYERINYSYVKH